MWYINWNKLEVKNMWKDSEAEIDFLDFDYLIGVLKGDTVPI